MTKEEFLHSLKQQILDLKRQASPFRPLLNKNIDSPISLTSLTHEQSSCDSSLAVQFPANKLSGKLQKRDMISKESKNMPHTMEVDAIEHSQSNGEVDSRIDHPNYHISSNSQSKGRSLSQEILPRKRKSISLTNHAPQHRSSTLNLDGSTCLVHTCCKCKDDCRPRSAVNQKRATSTKSHIAFGKTYYPPHSDSNRGNKTYTRKKVKQVKARSTSLTSRDILRIRQQEQIEDLQAKTASMRRHLKKVIHEVKSMSKILPIENLQHNLDNINGNQKVLRSYLRSRMKKLVDNMSTINDENSYQRIEIKKLIKIYNALSHKANEMELNLHNLREETQNEFSSIRHETDKRLCNLEQKSDLFENQIRQLRNTAQLESQNIDSWRVLLQKKRSLLKSNNDHNILNEAPKPALLKDRKERDSSRNTSPENDNINISGRSSPGDLKEIEEISRALNEKITSQMPNDSSQSHKNSKKFQSKLNKKGKKMRNSMKKNKIEIVDSDDDSEYERFMNHSPNATSSHSDENSYTTSTSILHLPDKYEKLKQAYLSVFEKKSPTDKV